MDTPPRQRITPSGKGKETSYVLLAAIIVLITCATLISLNQSTTELLELQNFQISAFADLNDQELAIFNGLYTSAYEIDEIHDEGCGEWLTVKDLEESLLPPFVKDSSWDKNGKYEWSRTLSPTGTIDVAIYIGNPADKTKSGAFILLFLHDHANINSSSLTLPEHAPFEIWFHASADKSVPSIITDQAFIAAGWKEVEALSGKEEIKRIKG